ncbi:MAG TPA: response regulator [Gammaproteobacteria bacterium]|nr:response regulator [Gammaproteobacteria bacterium]
MKVLVAEDDPVIRMLHQRQLTNWGYSVDLVMNGKEAVEHVHKSGEKDEVNYDLCLMDINMPIMSGIEAIQIIRKNATYLPIVACSASLNNKMPCLEAGADTFLLKPHSAVELKETLKEFAVKQNILYRDGERLSVCKTGPVDSEELTELRMLDKKGVAKFTVVDISSRFLVYKNMQDKLLDDFNNGNFRSAEIPMRIDRKGGLVKAYSSQVWLKKMSRTLKQFWTQVERENEILKKYERF